MQNHFKVKTGLEPNQWYGNVLFTEDMKQFEGKQGIVLAKHKSGGFYSNLSKDHVFSAEMVEVIEPIDKLKFNLQG